MNCHSVIVRELRRMARRRSTFHHRAIVCAWAMLLLGGISVWMDWMMASARPGTFMPPPKGTVVFMGLAVLLMLVCAIGGVSLTADCLSEERREGTLGLLFLTPLSGLDILLGKLVSSAMAAVYWILGILPVLSLTFLMGGVAFGEFFRLALTLLNTLFLSLAAGLFVSSLAEDARKAITSGIALVIFLAILMPFFAAMLIFTLLPYVDTDEAWFVFAVSPVYTLLESGVFPPMAGAGFERFVVSLLIVHAVGWGLVGVAAYWLPRSVKRESAKVADRVRKRNRRAAKVASWRQKPRFLGLRRRALAVEPYSWMMMSGRWCKRLLPTIFCIYMIGMCGLVSSIGFYNMVAFLLYFTAAFLKLWLLVEVTTRIAEERKTGSFELLLSSPLGVGGILRGIDRALIWQFGRSCCLLLTAGIVFYVVMDSMDSRRDGILIFGDSFAGLVRAFFWPAAVVFFLDLWALKWIGVWSAMRCRTAARALAASFGAIFLLPWLLVGLASASMSVLREVYDFNRNPIIIQSNSSDPVPWLWLTVFGGLAFGLGLWARDRVLRRFRLLAMHGFDYASAREEWLADVSPSQS